MDAEQVANDLAKHEAVCAERWKTAFNRFDDLDENVKRIETILISAAGALIVGGAGLIITLWNVHQEKIMELDYNKKDIAKSPKAKATVVELPEGVEVYEKRGMWYVKGDARGLHIFPTKEEAHKWLTK